MNTVFRSASVLALFAASLAASAQNLVTNGGFEAGDFTGYTVTNPNINLFVANQNVFGAQTIDQGTYSAIFGTVGSPSSISQTIGTVAGQRYTVSFDLRSGIDTFSISTPNSFVATFGGSTLLSLTDFPNSGGFHTYTYSLIGTGSDVLTFTAQNNPNYFALDQVSVTASSVPGPLAALPFALMAVKRRRKA